MNRLRLCLLVGLAVLGSVPLRAGAAPPGFELVAVALGRAEIEYGCGPTPGPVPTPPCPTEAHFHFRAFAEGSCTSSDFVASVRQRSTAQLVTIYKRTTAADCAIYESGTGRMRAFDVPTILVPGKRIRLTNPVPVTMIPRP
jgi:hypothetical protein